MLNRLSTNKIKLASVRYYDSQTNRIKLDDLPAFVVLYKGDECYINIFGFDELPVFEYSDDGELVHLCGSLVDGPCYILEDEVLFSEKNISIDNLKRFIIESEKFFIDRSDIIKSMCLSSVDSIRYKIIALSDETKLCELKRCFSSIKDGNQYKK